VVGIEPHKLNGRKRHPVGRDHAGKIWKEIGMPKSLLREGSPPSREDDENLLICFSEHCQGAAFYH
jgi:hypothetical protein